jgi:hypothetical protein
MENTSLAMLWYNFGLIRYTDLVGERPRGMGNERVDCMLIHFSIIPHASCRQQF